MSELFNTKPNCFIYLRRSQDREDRQSLSIEKQDTQVQQIITKENLNPIYLPSEERSAKHPGRPIFDDMMKRIEAGEVRYIAVWMLSRLSRNPVDGGRVIYALDTGKLLAIYTPNRTYRNTPDDKMVLGIELALAKKNNDDLGIQVKEGFETKRTHGQYPGPAPIGYVNAIIRPGERNIIPHTENAPKVIECFVMASKGVWTLDDVWSYAVDLGLKSKNGSAISKQTIHDMLQRRAYTGIFKYGGGEWHQGSYKPLIPVELFDAVQFAMGWKKKITRPNTTSGRSYSYKGLVLCRTCSFNITAYTKVKTLASGKEAEYIFYTCTKKSRSVECKESQISSKEMFTEIKSRFSEYELTESEGAECIDWLKIHHKDYVNNKSRFVKDWQKDLRDVKKAMDTLDDKLEAGIIPDDRYKARMSKHEETLARTTKQLANVNEDARQWFELATKTFSSVVNLSDVFELADEGERRKLMQYLGSNWYLGNKKVALTVRKPLDVLHVSNRNTNWRARPDSNRRSSP